MKREGDTVMVKECIRRDECATRSTGSEGENDEKDLRKTGVQEDLWEREP
jgi:hypothetical protein